MKIDYHKILLALILIFGIFAIIAIYLLQNEFLITIGIVGYYGFMLLDIIYVFGSIFFKIYKNAKKEYEKKKEDIK